MISPRGPLLANGSNPNTMNAGSNRQRRRSGRSLMGCVRYVVAAGFILGVASLASRADEFDRIEGETLALISRSP